MPTEDYILAALASGRFVLTKHARERMVERGVTKVDIMSCGRTARSATPQPDGTYRVKGKDESGDPLTVVCGYDGETVVITVF